MAENSYKVIVSPGAAKDLLKINLSAYVTRILKVLKELEFNPRPEGCKKLIGSQNTYRIRAGIYRIIYIIEDKILTVKVVKIDHRKTVYR